MKWTPERYEELRQLWAQPHLTSTDIARILGISRSAVLGASTRGNLHYRAGRPLILKDNHPAVLDAHTMYPKQVRQPDDLVLKPGSYQRKLGAVVKKGHWRGYPIFSLTLEERKTCPRDCKVWNACYGNGMQYAARYKAGDVLEAAIYKELEALQAKYFKGFVVRLHILGDFYSVRYVEFWKEALKTFPALHVFGYTAWQEGTEIGDAIANLRCQRWRRFAVRTSGAKDGLRTAVYALERNVPAGVVTCPAQTARTKCCATCALCWGSKKPIAFLKH